MRLDHYLFLGLELVMCCYIVRGLAFWALYVFPLAFKTLINYDCKKKKNLGRGNKLLCEFELLDHVYRGLLRPIFSVFSFKKKRKLLN